MRLTHGLQQAALHHADRLATIFAARKRTYAQVVNRVARLASGLRARDAQPGDRIAILALNSDVHYEAYYAVLWAGCLAPLPCNNRWTAAEHADGLSNCEPALILVDENFREFAASLPADLKGRVIALGDGDHGTTNTEKLIAASLPMRDNCGDGDAPAAIFYTGGTTGKSKGAILSHDNLMVNFLAPSAVEPFERVCTFILHVARPCFTWPMQPCFLA